MDGVRLSSVTIMYFDYNSLIAIVLNSLTILFSDCNSMDVSALALKHY